MSEMKKQKIPKIPYWLLKKMYIFDSREGFAGDIEEEFEEIVNIEGHIPISD